MVRGPSIDKNGMKKGAWSQEEDNKLRAYIHRYGHWNWRQLPKYAGLARCGKSCRLRWMNYLQPNVKHGNYTKEEEDLILKLHNDLGNKWSVIAANLPGRSDNEIKNYWHTNLKKRAKRNSILSRKECGGSGSPESVGEIFLLNVKEEQKLTIDAYSPVTTLGSFDPTSSESSPESFYELNEDIWAEPFLEDLTNEFLCPSGDDFFSPPSPVMVQDFLWPYELLSYESITPINTLN